MNVLYGVFYSFIKGSVEQPAVLLKLYQDKEKAEEYCRQINTIKQGEEEKHERVAFCEEVKVLLG